VGVVSLGLAVLMAAPACVVAEATARATESEARLRKDITFLASDECEGRGATTKGLQKAADYIANEFKKAGLKPGNPDGTYFQTFTIPGTVQLAEPKLVLTGPKGQVIELKPGVHFHALGAGGSGAVKDAPVVFAGYGVSSETMKYDDYDGLDVAGKVVVLLRDVPRSNWTEFGPKLRAQAPFSSKMGRAAERKAKAVLFINDADTARTGDDLVDFNFTAVYSQGSPLPALHIKRSVVEQMLATGQTETLADMEKTLDADFKPQSCPLEGWRATLEVQSKRDKLQLKNVIGVLEGAGALAKETVVVGAHYDHLGYGGQGGSLARLKKMAIHHGADDNGSGSTTVMELARRFGQIPNRQGRRLVFMTYSGEELGLLGSKYYCEEKPLFPLADTIAMVNLDMVGRLKTDAVSQPIDLLVEGKNTSKAWPDLLEQVNKKHHFNFKSFFGLAAVSDHYWFYRNKVPVLFIWTGIHEDYHKPSDTSDKINVAGMRQIADFTEEVIADLAVREKRPGYVEVKTADSGGGRRDGPRLGILPDYSDDKEGVMIDGTTNGTPAAKAGLKKGDRIVQLAGQPVKNIQGYMTLMGSKKKGDEFEIGIIRDGKPQKVKVKLE
jgi:hypothetical protein